MERSSLINEVYLSPNYNPRNGIRITRITPHCMQGQAYAINIAKSAKFTTNHTASANYLIGTKGEILLNVEECNRAWTSGSRDNDYQAITIECASDATNPYAFNNTVYTQLFLLIVDICKRYNRNKVVWISDKSKALSYICKDNEMQITVHRWFQNVACPGDWLMNKMQTLVDACNAELNKNNVTPSVPTDKLYKVQVGAFKNKDNADKLLAKLKEQGYTDAYIKYE